MKSFALPLLALLLGVPQPAGADLVRRFTLTIDGISEQPRMFDLTGLELGVGVVELEDGSAFVAKSPDPESARVGEIGLWIPEVDDEVLVAFSDWVRRLLARPDLNGGETRHADLVGYDPAGNVVSRWRLRNVWPSRITLPNYDADSTTPRRYLVALQADEISRAPLSGLAPWPEVRSARIDPETRTFTMSWRSAPGATYSLYRWDARGKQPILVEGNLLATGDTATFSRLMEEEGIYWVVLTSAPPAPETR